MFRFHWVVTPEQAYTQMMDAYAAQVRAGIYQILLNYVPLMEAYMKTEAGWTDRTALARATLHTWVEAMSDFTVIALFADHGMEYGEFLEQGRFAIIAPAIDHFFPQIMRDIRRLL